MTVNRQYTPIPQETIAPIQTIISDHLNIPSNDSKTILRVSDTGEQVIDVREIGGRPEDSVFVSVGGEKNTTGGTESVETEVESSALNSFGNKATGGPIANSSFSWRAVNRSGTDYNSGGGNKYQTFINYVIRRMTIAEKLASGVPVNSMESDLASKYNISDRLQLNVPVVENGLNEPNLADKDVIKHQAVPVTLDISQTGQNNPVKVASETDLRNRGLVAYVTGLEINSQNYTAADNLQVQFVRGGTDKFYRVETYGMPGYNEGYKADLHVPFLDKMNVNIFAENAINDVDVQLEYALVRRNIIEKALYGLENEVISNDDMADARFDIYSKIRERARVGVEIDRVIENIEFSQQQTVSGG